MVVSRGRGAARVVGVGGPLGWLLLSGGSARAQEVFCPTGPGTDPVPLLPWPWLVAGMLALAAAGAKIQRHTHTSATAVAVALAMLAGLIVTAPPATARDQQAPQWMSRLEHVEQSGAGAKARAALNEILALPTVRQALQQPDTQALVQQLHAGSHRQAAEALAGLRDLQINVSPAEQARAQQLMSQPHVLAWASAVAATVNDQQFRNAVVYQTLTPRQLNLFRMTVNGGPCADGQYSGRQLLRGGAMAGAAVATSMAIATAATSPIPPLAIVIGVFGAITGGISVMLGIAHAMATDPALRNKN
jgi:hypothetical protein